MVNALPNNLEAPSANPTVEVDVDALGAVRNGTPDEALAKVLTSLDGVELTADNADEIRDRVLASGAVTTADEKAAKKAAMRLAVFIANNGAKYAQAIKQAKEAAAAPKTTNDKPADIVPAKSAEESAKEGLETARSLKLKQLFAKLEIQERTSKAIVNPRAAVEALLAHPDKIAPNTAYDTDGENGWEKAVGYVSDSDKETRALNVLLSRLAETIKGEDGKALKDANGKVRTKAEYLKEYDDAVDAANVDYFRADDKHKSSVAKTRVEAAIREGWLLKENDEPKKLEAVHYGEYFNNVHTIAKETGMPMTKRYDEMKPNDKGVNLERDGHFNKFLNDADKEVNLGSALAVIVRHADTVKKDEQGKDVTVPGAIHAVWEAKGLENMGEEFWRGMSYQPDGRMDEDEILSMNMLYLRAQHSPEFAAFLKAKLADYGKDAQSSDKALKEVNEGKAERLFRDLKIEENEEAGVLPEKINLISAADTIYAYVTRNEKGGKALLKNELNKEEWGKDGLFSDESGRCYKPTGMGWRISDAERDTLNAILAKVVTKEGKADAANLSKLYEYTSLYASGVKPNKYDAPQFANVENTTGKALEGEKNLDAPELGALELLAKHPGNREAILGKLGFTPEAVAFFGNRTAEIEPVLRMIANGTLTAGNKAGKINKDDLVGKLGFPESAIQEGSSARAGRNVGRGETFKRAGTLDIIQGIRKALIARDAALKTDNANLKEAGKPELLKYGFAQQVEELKLYLRSPEAGTAFEQGQFARPDEENDAKTDRFSQAQYLANRLGNQVEPDMTEAKKAETLKRELAGFIADADLSGEAGDTGVDGFKGKEKTVLYREMALFEALKNNLSDTEMARAPYYLAWQGGLPLDCAAGDEVYKKGIIDVKNPEQAVGFLRAHPSVKPYISEGLRKIGGSTDLIVSKIKDMSKELDQQVVQDAARAAKEAKDGAAATDGKAATDARTEANAAQTAAENGKKTLTPEPAKTLEPAKPTEEETRLKNASEVAAASLDKARKAYALIHQWSAAADTITQKPFDAKDPSAPSYIEQKTSAIKFLTFVDNNKKDFDAAVAEFKQALATIDDRIAGKVIRKEWAVKEGVTARADMETELAALIQDPKDGKKGAEAESKNAHAAYEAWYKDAEPKNAKFAKDTTQQDLEQVTKMRAQAVQRSAIVLNTFLEKGMDDVDFDGWVVASGTTGSDGTIMARRKEAEKVGRDLVKEQATKNFEQAAALHYAGQIDEAKFTAYVTKLQESVITSLKRDPKDTFANPTDAEVKEMRKKFLTIADYLNQK